MGTLDQKLDAAPTLRELLSYPLGFPRMEMTWEAYLALPRGLHDSRVYDGVSREKEGHTFPVGNPGAAGYAMACYAKWVSYTPPREGEEIEGGRVTYEHFLLTVGGEPVLLRPTKGPGYPHGLAVEAGNAPHGQEIEYKI